MKGHKDLKPNTERATLRMESIWSEAEQRVIQDIVRRIRKNGKITSTADYQINRLKEMGKSSEEIEKILKDALNATWPEMFKLYDDVYEWEYVRNKDIYEQVNREFVPPEDNKWLIQMSEAVKEQTKDELTNISQSYGFAVNMNGKTVFMPFAEYYQKYVDAAIMDVITGNFDYNTVLRRVVKQMTNSGLRTVDYASGWSNRTPVAVRRAVMAGISQITGKISERNAKILGTDHYEVTWHSGARPDHRVWQGKVYTYKQLETVCGLGTVTGLHGANCGHDYYPFIPGVSERMYTDEWLAEQNRKESIPREWHGKQLDAYGVTQQQRKMETAMRAQRSNIAALKAGDYDPDQLALEKAKYQAQLYEYTVFSNKMGIPQQRERIYMDGLGRLGTNTKKQNARYTPEMMKNSNKDLKEFEKYRNILKGSSVNLEEFRQIKYNDHKKYELLQGYKKAIDKGDVYVLTGFDQYLKTAKEIDQKIVGMETSEGVKINSYSTHFVDRVIGQTSTTHEDMRLGTPVSDVKDALKNPIKLGKIKTMENGDIRQKYYGKNASVVISIRDNLVIQATPEKGE